MNNIDEKKVISLWDKDGGDLIKPSIFYAFDSQNIKYFVFRDNSSIIYLIPSDCETTFVIPKKYCSIEKRKDVKCYKINDINKLLVISCIGTKNNYEKFVLDKLVINPNC